MGVCLVVRSTWFTAGIRRSKLKTYCPDIAQSVQKNQKPPVSRGLFSERYWDRTSDLFRVREARYRCANRSCIFSFVKPQFTTETYLVR